MCKTHQPNKSMLSSKDQLLTVTGLVCKERQNITRIQMEGVTIDNTIGSLAALADSLWFGNAVKAHLHGQCLDMHKV